MAPQLLTIEYMNASKDRESIDRRQALMQQILQYLTAHPDAKDTLDGILKWWLPSYPIEWKKEEVQEALDHSVAEEWVVRRNLSPSRVLYSMNKGRLEQIRKYLTAREDKPKRKNI